MKQFLAFILTFTISASARAEVRLPALFSDGAVLQCDQDLPVWGWGKPGEKVSVRFAGQAATTEVKPDGSWMVRLQPVKPSYKKHTMVIKVGAHALELKNIVVGEVWLCSGQSNMMYTLEAISARTKDAGYAPVLDYMGKERDSASDDFLRQIRVPTVACVTEAKPNFAGRWIQSSPQNNAAFTATGYFFGKELRKHLDHPVGLLSAAWGGRRIDGFLPPPRPVSPAYRRLLEDVKRRMERYDAKGAEEEYQRAHAKWREEVKAAHASGKPRPRPPKRPVSPDTDSNVLGGIYHGMIHPLVPYAIRGALWYQGESHNKQRPETYGRLLKTLILGWRREWGQGEFPVYYCQLASFTSPRAEPLQDNNSWVTVCNQQRLAMKIPHTGMAVLNDIGQVKDIHPANKLDVGRRLSRWALNKTYGFEKVVPSGPLYRSFENKGKIILVKFSYPGSGLMVGRKHLLNPVRPVDAPLGGFEICGGDRTWVYAKARIVSKDEVAVSHPTIDSPLAVRYGWQQNPANANLYNREGLPTSLFTTLAPEP